MYCKLQPWPLTLDVANGLKISGQKHWGMDVSPWYTLHLHHEPTWSVCWCLNPELDPPDLKPFGDGGYYRTIPLLNPSKFNLSFYCKNTKLLIFLGAFRVWSCFYMLAPFMANEQRGKSTYWPKCDESQARYHPGMFLPVGHLKR